MDDKRAEKLVDRYADPLLRMGYTLWGEHPAGTGQKQNKRGPAL